MSKVTKVHVDGHLIDTGTLAAIFDRIARRSPAGARLVYWNMMAPRRVPVEQAHRVRTLTALEDELKAIDRAFFYSDFVIEEVL